MKQADSNSNPGSCSARSAAQFRLSLSEQVLFDELEKLMALNTPVDRATADLPVLWAMIGSPGDSGALIELIHASIADLPEPQRKALTCLFTDDLGSWSGNLTGRKRFAARYLGKPYNTARARRDGQPNDFDALLILLVRSLDIPETTAGTGTASPGGRGDMGAGTSRTPERQEDSSGRTGRRRLDPLEVGVGVVLTVVLLALALFVLSGNDGPVTGSAGAETAVTTDPGTTANTDPASPRLGVATPDALGEAQIGRIFDCDRPIGGPLVPATDNVWITPLMIGAYRAALVDGFDLGCPSATAQPWGAVWFQPIEGSDPSQAGTIVVSRAEPEGASSAAEASATGSSTGDVSAVFLPRTVWLAYHNIGLDGGDSAQSLAGFPTDFSVDAEGHWITHMSRGGIIVTEQPNTSGRWIPQQAMPLWESYGGMKGELGLPMTNVEYVDGLITQTYQHGKAFLGPDAVVRGEVYDQATIDTEVATLPRRSNGILSSYDSTDWWIDGSGVRHWIPSGPDHDGDAMWDCLGGLDNTIAEGLNGWIIADFPLGDNATCPAE